MARGYIGIRECRKTVWPTGGSPANFAGPFLNFGRSSAPTVRPDNTPLAVGDVYYDTGNLTWNAYNGSAFVNLGAAGSTSLGGAYTNGATITIPIGGPKILFTNNDTGAFDSLDINATAAGSGTMLAISYTGANTGTALTINMTNAATTAAGISITGPAAATTGNFIAIADAGTSTGSLIALSQSSISSAKVIKYTTSGAVTGNVADWDLTNAGTAARALVIKGQTGARTPNSLVSIQENGTGSVPTVLITGGGVTTGALLSITATVAVAPVAGTNGMQTINMTTAATTAQGLLIIGPAAGRTGGCIAITDAGTSTGPLLDLSCSSTSSASLIKFATTGTITGKVIDINLTNSSVAATGISVTGAAATQPALTIGAGLTSLKVTNYQVNAQTKTTSYSIVTADAGSCFTNAGAVGAVNFTLPALAAGNKYWFYVAADQSFAITAPGANLMMNNTAGGTSLKTSVTINTAVQRVGVWAHVWCDGTNYYICLPSNIIAGNNATSVAITYTLA